MVYQQVKTDLQNGRKVLFSGTPCQTVALRNVIGKDSPNLYVIDIVCHGVPSQKMFRECLAMHASLEKNRALLL